MLRRRWPFVLGPLGIVVAVALIGLIRAQPEYEASSRVLISGADLAGAVSGTPGATDTYQDFNRVIQTQIEIATSPVVRDRTLRAFRLSLGEQGLADKVAVVPKPNSDVLTISVRFTERATAVRLTNEYARQYTNYRQQLDTAALSRARRELRGRLSELRRTGLGSGAVARRLERSDESLQTLEALQTSNASVIANARVATQISPQPRRTLVLALALGLVLGLTLALARNAFDTRVTDEEDITDGLRLPLLAMLPRPEREVARGGLAMLHQPSGKDAEATRLLRTNLELTRLTSGAKVIMVTSAVEQEGKSTVISNLAVAYARAGSRVLLVDCDLRRPSIDKYFGLQRRPGVTDVALGRVTLDSAQQVVALPAPSTVGFADRSLDEDEPVKSVHVLTAGPLPPDPGEFVGGGRLAEILGAARDQFDIVFVDAPPVLPVGDPVALSAQVDAVMFVARLNVIKRSMLPELRRLLDRIPADLLGVVITDATVSDKFSTYSYTYASVE